MELAAAYRAVQCLITSLLPALTIAGRIGPLAATQGRETSDCVVSRVVTTVTACHSSPSVSRQVTVSQLAAQQRNGLSGGEAAVLVQAGGGGVALWGGVGGVGGCQLSVVLTTPDHPGIQGASLCLHVAGEAEGGAGVVRAAGRDRAGRGRVHVLIQLGRLQGGPNLRKIISFPAQSFCTNHSFTFRL